VCRVKCRKSRKIGFGWTIANRPAINPLKMKSLLAVAVLAACAAATAHAAFLYSFDSTDNATSFLDKILTMWERLQVRQVFPRCR
jgi:hypothetical protein